MKKKIIAIVLVMAVIIITIVGYEIFIVNSLSGYTKVSLESMQTYSIKFGNTAPYNVTFLLNAFPEPNAPITIAGDTTIQASLNNSIKYFATVQGARYSFSGLQIVVGNAYYKQVNSNRETYLNLYVKSAVTNFKPIISSVPYTGIQ